MTEMAQHWFISAPDSYMLASHPLEVSYPPTALNAGLSAVTPGDVLVTAHEHTLQTRYAPNIMTAASQLPFWKQLWASQHTY